MSGYDPLSANGILYSSPHDIVMSDGPIYFASPLDQRIGRIPPNDSFEYGNNSTNKVSTWKKWLLGLALAGLTIFGIKKFGTKHIKKFAENHPSIKNIGTRISKGYHSVIDFCKSHNPFKKKTTG